LVDEVLILAQGKARVILDPSPYLRTRIHASYERLQQALRHQAVYGVTTGFGDSCENEIPDYLAQQLPLFQS
jgi:histidine ammonia-lyase